MHLIQTILRRGLLLVSVYGLLCIPAGVFLAEGALHPARRALPSNAARDASRTFQASGDDFQEVSIVAGDGRVLSAWSIRPPTPDPSTVILLHGLSDNRLGMLGYAGLFLRHGYAVLMPDARGHGVSGGELVTYGLQERSDIHRWVEWLVASYRPDCVFALGESMGAAQLLQALSTDSVFCAVVAESPFSDFREIAYDRMGQQFETGPWVGRTVLRPVVEAAFLYARWKYHVDVREVSPLESVAATKVPVLLIHGQNDRNIPIRHSRRIRDRNAAVILWEVPHADHCGAMGTAPQQFEQMVLGWFQLYSQKASSQPAP